MGTDLLQLYAIESACALELQLHVQPDNEAGSTLYGWDITPPPVDAGPPEIIENVIAAALVKCGMLAFLTLADPPVENISYQTWLMTDDDYWIGLPSSTLNRLFRRRVPSVMATRSRDRARALFTGVSWSQQQQVGFLFQESQLPGLTQDLIMRVLSARNAPYKTLQLPDEVLALLLPAVDGDFLEAVAREQSMRDAIRAAVAFECERRSILFSARSSFRAT